MIASRRAKLEAWRGRGAAYPNSFRRSDLAVDLHQRHAADSKAELEERQVPAGVAGRIMLRRVMGKAAFFTIQDVSGRIQVYARVDDLGEQAYADIEHLMDIGDLVGVDWRNDAHQPR